ncbi:MAG: DUF2520 domain-containing protein [Bacteroidales bacterium]|nr:DUF2520 domain-containing protein [Bacteroidales bacterium]
MIALIGSGNVAHWVAERLRHSQEFRIAQVYSRQLEHAQELAAAVGAEAIDDLSRLNPCCDIYLFSVKDDAYRDVLCQIPFRMPVALHTAGTVSQEVFETFAREYGVLYPLQTFSKHTNLSELEVPLCVENNHINESRALTMRLAQTLSDTCHIVCEEQRAVLHLAAVFANNFGNAMASIADDILKANGMDIKMLLPLMRQTLNKLHTLSPAEAQTGPAARSDRTVMEKHLKMLPDEKTRTIYTVISDYIMDNISKKENLPDKQTETAKSN